MSSQLSAENSKETRALLDSIVEVDVFEKWKIFRRNFLPQIAAE